MAQQGDRALRFPKAARLSRITADAIVFASVGMAVVLIWAS
jgi:hypothetical protein